jgi:hypothetical protein
MDTTLTNLLLLLAGVFFGLLSNILTNKSTNFHWLSIGFYLLGVCIGVFCIYMIFSSWKVPDTPNIKNGFIGIFISILYLVAVYFLLNQKEKLYTPFQLDPFIRKFTDNSKVDTLKMFAGDLNFLGDNPTEMDNNEQFKQLTKLGFNKVQILCKKPDLSSPDSIKRYGKVLSDIKNVELRFYTETVQDLKLRGRFAKYAPSVDAMSIYERINATHYRVIESNINNYDCGLFIRIFKMTWANAEIPNNTDISSWIAQYKSIQND